MTEEEECVRAQVDGISMGFSCFSNIREINEYLSLHCNGSLYFIQSTKETSFNRSAVWGVQSAVEVKCPTLLDFLFLLEEVSRV